MVPFPRGRFVCADIKDVWNFFDWLCYTIYLLAWKIGQTYLTLSRSRACTSAVCVGVGYHDDYEVFAAGQSLKFYLSLAICLQVLLTLSFRMHAARGRV